MKSALTVPVRPRSRRTLTALLLLASAAPAYADEPPDVPDFDLPEQEWRDLVTPNTLTYQEGLELEAALRETGDPELSTWLDDFVFDYDEGCWEEFGEQAHPVWIDPVTRARADHRLTTTKDELQAHFPDGGGPVANLFPEPEGEGELLKAREASVLPAYSLNESDLEIAAGIQDVGDETTPMTSGAVDLRYMDESSLPEVAATIAEALSNTGGEIQVETSSAGVTMTGENIDVEVVSAEFQAAGGVPQSCLEPTPEMCLDARWHDSWCGRQAFEEHGADPAWICAEALRDSVDDFVLQNGGAVGPVLEPETTYEGGTRFEHVGNVRASGLTIPLLDDSDYMESNEGALPTELKAADVAARAAKVAGWASNNATLSCEEFAFEYHQDASNLDEVAKAHQRDPQWIFDVVMFGRDGLGPYTDAGSRYRPDFRTDAGSRIWYLDTDVGGGDFGFVPWERYGIGSPLPDPDMPHRIKGEYDVHYPSRWRYKTFKNVYYFLHRLRKGAGDDFQGTCVDYKEELYDHYHPSMVWHFGMDRTAKQEGFLVDEMERMRRKQDALWKLYEDYSLSDDPSHRQELTERIDAALREGYASGCIPMDPNQPTVCDWAPSLLVDGLMERVHHFRGADEAACEAELGPEPQSNASIREKFVEVPWRTEYDATAYQAVVDRRNEALSWSFTSGAGPFGRYLHLMKGSGQGLYAGYRDLVVDLFTASGVRDALTTTIEEKRAIDGEYFGAGFETFGQSTANLEVSRACDPVPFNTAEGAVQISLGGVGIDVLDAASTGTPDELFVNVHISNDLVWVPGGGFQNCHAIGVEGGWSIWEYAPDTMSLGSVGIVELVAGLKAAGDVSASAGGRYCHTDHALQPLPEDQLIPNGDHPCGEATTNEASFTLSLGGRLDGYAFLAVQVAKILRFGVKGDLTLLSLDMPTTWSTSTTTNNPERTPVTTDRRRTVLKLKLASGKLSVFVDLNLGVVSVEVFDLMLVNWHGLHLDKPLADTEGEYDLCMTTEIGLIGAGSIGHESDPCPCRFRPANCHDDDETSDDEGDA